MRLTAAHYRAIVSMLLPLLLAGCSSSRVWRNAIPACAVESGVSDRRRSQQEAINFVRLAQGPPPAYLVGPRDTLGIFIEGVLGSRDEPPPVHYSEKGNIPPALGYPIPVREDGTIALPLVPPIRAEGLTLPQLEREIRRAYTVDRFILQEGRDRILVTLMKPRTYQVLVVREDTTNPGLSLAGMEAGEVTIGSGRRGAMHIVELPAYENDILHALSESGGLPGLDAKNEVTILRRAFDPTSGPMPELLPSELPMLLTPDLRHPNVMKIPLRAIPGEPLPALKPHDVILNAGDVVYIESRDAEVFYSGGLLKGGQFPIPRDYDLDVFGAIAMAGGSVAAAAGGSGTVGGPSRGGVGSIFPPTRAIVLRQEDGEQIAIRINLKKAMLDPAERILIQPDDIVLLEYTPYEVVMNMLLNNLNVSMSLTDIF